MPKILILGGTGVFGGRLVEGLLATTEFEIVAMGRNRARLNALAERCRRPGRVSVRVIDRGAIDEAALRAAGAVALVDCAGPFQGGDYRLALAAIGAGLHYLDLADARDFVAGFGTLDAAAKAAGVAAFSGASSTPALSNAAADALTRGWRRVDSVAVAIAPGNRAPRGLSVVRAILSYAGRPVPVFEDGGWTTRPGWGMTIRRTLPGLGPRWLSLCETPDLDLLPRRFPTATAAVFRAGLELPVLHLGLLAASWLVRAGALRSLAPAARPFRLLAAALGPFGTDRGGMIVEATGLDADCRPVRAVWSLIAEAGDGPLVPTVPALALLKALASGRIAPGASACVGVLGLAEIEAEFRPHRIASSIAVTALPHESLYETVLGPAFAVLPPVVRALHRPDPMLRATGTARIDGAVTLPARLAAFLFGLPRGGDAVPVEVTIRRDEAGEVWTRNFGGRAFASTMGAGADPGRVVERFGRFAFELELLSGPHGIAGMPVRAWRLGGIRLPLPLAPATIASEAVDDAGRFRFDVEIRLPLGLGRIVRYAGWLVPITAP